MASHNYKTTEELIEKVLKYNKYNLEKIGK
jgi:hypothetical protein